MQCDRDMKTGRPAEVSDPPAPPSYEVVSRAETMTAVEHSFESGSTSYRDVPELNRESLLHYSSETSGPAAEGRDRKSRLVSLFGSRGSRSDASLSLRNLYSDIIQNPTSATKDVFMTICATCKKGNIPLVSISAKLENHYPIFWMIVRRKTMPGTIEAFLSQDNSMTSITDRDVNEGQAACLVIDSVDLYRSLEFHRSRPRTYRGSAPNVRDLVDVIKTEEPILGFLADITFKDFVARYRVQKHLMISFPARHREWTLHLGTSILPEQFQKHSQNHGNSRKVMELMMEAGDCINCTARVRLRHPTHATESEWLDLGTLRTVSDAMRHVDTRAVDFNGFCGPLPLNRNSDWQALELGEEEYIDREGNLTVQLQIIATKAAVHASGGDCCVQ